ncbi:MAG: hypothetical protein FWE35_04825 [Streptosporangiales bacterium]|nr:hypothetical protein [Streptosporangiales bacterium]
MSESGAAPCQCSSPGGAQTVSPGRRGFRSPSRVSTAPLPLATRMSCPSSCECQ